MRFLVSTVSPASQTVPAASSQKDKRSASAWQQGEQRAGAGSRLGHHLSLAPSRCSACSSCLLELHTVTPQHASSPVLGITLSKVKRTATIKVKIGSKVRTEGSYTEHGRCSQEEHIPWRDASGKGEVRTHHPSQDGSLWGVTSAASGTDLPKPLTGIHFRVSFSLINIEPLPLQSY